MDLEADTTFIESMLINAIELETDYQSLDLVMKAVHLAIAGLRARDATIAVLRKTHAHATHDKKGD